MFRKLIAASACCVLAAAAMAGTLEPNGKSTNSKVPGEPGAEISPDSTRTGINVPINVDGIESWDPLSDPSNTVLIIDVAAGLGLPSGTPVTMNGIGWDVTITTNSPSWLSEARVYFDDDINPDLTGLFLAPGVNDSFSGSASYSSGGIIKLADAGIPDIPLPDGNLRVEFYESFDDFADGVDAVWAGTITVQAVPEPGALSLLALAGLALIRRR